MQAETYILPNFFKVESIKRMVVGMKLCCLPVTNTCAYESCLELVLICGSLV